MSSNALEGHKVNVTSMRCALEWTVVSGGAHDTHLSIHCKTILLVLQQHPSAGIFKETKTT